MPKPTSRQLSWFKRYGIEPLKTKSASSAVIGYIIEGNGLGDLGETSKVRLLKLKAKQAEYEGKVVRYRSEGTLSEETFTVGRVYPKSRSEIREREKARKLFKDLRPSTNPFKATQKGGKKGSWSATSLGNLVLCEEEESSTSSGN